jgi:DNA polymerase IV
LTESTRPDNPASPAESSDIVHLDMDAYFASVEQRDTPMYRGRPLVVCHTDDPGSNRGVVSAASYEARAYGVRAGTSVLEARKVLKDSAVFVSGNYDKYLYNTRKIRDICRRYSDAVEIYSVDELFLDVSGSKQHFGGAAGAAVSLKRAIKSELNLTASVGVGPNKLVAKMASELNKPDGLTVISPADLPGVFAPLPVGDIVGIGRRMKRHFDAIGVRTIGELSEVPVEYLTAKFGVVGTALHNASLGIDGSVVSARQAQEYVKSFGHTHALGGGISDKSELKRLLLGLCEGVARRMRKEEYYGRAVHLRLSLARLFSVSRSKTTAYYTREAKDIFRLASELLDREEELFTAYPATLIGVSVTKLANARDGIQMSIFDFIDKKPRELTDAVDAVRNKFGERAVFPASLDSWKRVHHTVPKLELGR